MSELIEIAFGYVQGLADYLTWDNAKILGAAVAVVWVAAALNKSTGLVTSLRSLVGRVFGGSLDGIRSRGEAAAAEKAGQWLEAGLLHDRLGDWEKALDCYERAEEYHLAGELCLRLGHKEVAAEWFLQSNEKLRAAKLYRELGRHARSAEAYEKAGNTLEAASEFLEAGAFTKAAAIYERAGDHIRAAEAYDRASDPTKAGESFARQVAELEGRGSHYRSRSQDAELARLCHRAGRAFQKAGQAARAVELYEKGGQVRLAAQLAEEQGSLPQAAELYRKAGAVEKAAELYERAGDARAAGNLLADQKLSGGDAIAAAEAFLNAGDALRAAEVFEDAGRFDRAASCYEQAEAFGDAAEAALRAEDRSRAADLFVKADKNDRAAELYVELGDPDRASLLFAEASRFFDAARAAAEANAEKKMVEYLQQVPADDPNYFVAVVELAKAFERRGWASLAREKLKTVLQGQEVTAKNLELWDQLARAEEAEGNLEEAAHILHRVMAVQYGHRSAAARLAALKERIDEETERSEIVRVARGVVPREQRERYEIGGMLGRGGMGAVYKAYDHLLKRSVAYKVLSDSLSRDDSARDQLLDEARAAAALNHPNIVTVYDLGFDGDKAFICMELIEGESYSSLLRKHRRLSMAQATHWLVSTCQGLHHAHSRGIVHRDLKPSNVLLTVDNRVKILDFGLARAAADGQQHVESWGESMSGTPKYISPEAIQGLPPDPRSDIYSLGATLYELLVGRAPFSGGDVLVQHLHRPPPPLRAARGEIDPMLEELVLLCLAKTPEERFQSAGEIVSFAQAARLI